MKRRSASLHRGFRGPHSCGGWIAAAIGLVSALFSASSAAKERKKQERMQQDAIEAGDPYAAYRDDAAKKLNALTAESVMDTQQYKTRQQAVERIMAAQGYTGSGNALIEASNAGGAAYQQEFDNLARQAGIDKQPGYGYSSALSSGAASSQAYMGQVSGIANSIAYNAGKLWEAWSNRGSGGGTE